MTAIAYREGLAAEDFLVLAQRVWPGDYSATQAAAALEGEYTVSPAGRYGAKPSETLRVDCSRGAAIAAPGT